MPPSSEHSAEEGQQDELLSPKHAFDDDIENEVTENAPEEGEQPDSEKEGREQDAGQDNDGGGDDSDSEKRDEGNDKGEGNEDGDSDKEDTAKNKPNEESVDKTDRTKENVDGDKKKPTELKDNESGDEGSGDGNKDAGEDSKQPAPKSPSSAAPSVEQGADEDEDEDLYTQITKNPSSVVAVAREWFARVQKNGPTAVADLLSLIVRLARPPGSPPYQLVTPSMVMQNKPSQSVREISLIMRQDVPGVVPIRGKDPASKRVRRAYEDLWRRIGTEAPPAVLFDTDCHETLISWFDAMSVATTRTLRLAACVGAYRMVDGFIEYGNKLRSELKSMQKQLQTEKKKCGVTDAPRGKGQRQASKKTLSEKGMDLMKKVDQWTMNLSDLADLSDRVFQRVVIIKYRDISIDIRALTVTKLGNWILSDPEQFLDDHHSKYIGWLLSDKDAEVRRTSLEILSKLAQKPDFFPSSADFFQRFGERIAEMTLDRDDSVAVEAIHLCRYLSQYEALPEDSYELICDIAIEGPAAEIRRAAGQFLIHVLQFNRRSEDEGTIGAGSKRGSRKKQPVKRRRRPKLSNPFLIDPPPVETSEENIKELMFAVTRKGNIEEVGAELAVDAVWDHMPALRSWGAFLSILNDKAEQSTEVPKGRDGKGKSASRRRDPSPGEENRLTDEDKALVCEMLLASAREASGSGDDQRKQQLAACEFSDTESPASQLTAVFLPELTGLLVKYQADTRALTALVQLPVYFHTGSVEQESNEKNFEDMVLKLIDIMSRYTGSPELVNSCASTFKALTTGDTALKKLTLTSLQLGCSTAAKDLALLVRADLSEAEPVSVAAAVLRIKVMSELVIPNASVYPSVVKLLEYQIEKAVESNLGDDVTADAIRTSCALLFWSLSQVRSRLATTKDEEAARDFVASDEASEIQEKCSNLVSLVCQVCALPSFSVAVRMVSLRSLLSILVCARGVEKFASSLSFQNEAEVAEGENTMECELERMDLLQIKEKVDEVTATIKSCLIAIVRHRLSNPSEGLTPKNRRTSWKITDISQESVRDCFASLVQCSYQSELSGKIAQLPLLGFLLKEKKLAARPPISGWTVYELCKHYCQQRPHKESARIREEVLALTNAVDLAEVDEDHSLVRELAVHILNLRAPGAAFKKAAGSLLSGLMDNVIDGDVADDNHGRLVIALIQGGLAYVEHLSDDDAKVLLEKAKQVEALLNEHSSIPPFFDMLYSAIEAVSKEKRPEVPKLVPARLLSKSRTRLTKKRRRTQKDPGAYFTSSQAEVGNVRRSGRDRKQVNYAKLGGVLMDEGSEEESSGAEASAEESEESEPEIGEQEPSTAAEVGRQLMTFSSSPRVPSRQRPPPIPIPLISRKSRKGPSSKPKENVIHAKSRKEDAEKHNREEDEEGDDSMDEEREGEENDKEMNEKESEEEGSAEQEQERENENDDDDGEDFLAPPTIPPKRGRPGKDTKGHQKFGEQSLQIMSPSRSGRVRKPSAKLREASESLGRSPSKSNSRTSRGSSRRSGGLSDKSKRQSSRPPSSGDKSSQELMSQQDSPVPAQQSPHQAPPVRRSKRDGRRRSFSLEDKENIDETGQELTGKKRGRGNLQTMGRKKNKRHKKW